ncbi:hypothetical protein ACH5RR_000433 [Cinchona calisaya]|uniref:Uncharacterized protein n=1 Tax=Cinchona calisaya TaxID=153742 RepID=A0ABD3B0M3_9GENT
MTPHLYVPSDNSIFFNGDKVEGTGNAVIERLSDIQKIAEILVSKFGSSINAWVVEASTFNGPFAVYKDFIPTIIAMAVAGKICHFMGTGAYLTNKDVIGRRSDHLTRRAFGIRCILHGTPRQWCDRWRTWIHNEKNELFRLLKLAARKNMGKLILCERLYSADRPPSLQMHFEIIENLDVS